MSFEGTLPNEPLAADLALVGVAELYLDMGPEVLHYVGLLSDGHIAQVAPEEEICL